jgi:hypothetical protein
MGISQDLPQRFVCDNCQIVYAGTPERHETSVEYHAPDACPVCSETAFVMLEQFSRMHGQV